VITFQGRTVGELRQAFRDSVDDHLDRCAARGKAPDRPYSGRLLLRLGPALHRAADLAARRDGKGLDAWVAERVARAAGAGEG
jgi:predicted HicB family RNase H-like nuclease